MRASLLLAAAVKHRVLLQLLVVGANTRSIALSPPPHTNRVFAQWRCHSVVANFIIRVRWVIWDIAVALLTKYCLFFCKQGFMWRGPCLWTCIYIPTSSHNKNRSLDFGQPNSVAWTSDRKMTVRKAREAVGR